MLTAGSAGEWGDFTMKLMALDGNSIVNRAFYGVSQNLTTRSGQPTNAVLGFLNILNKQLEDSKPDALCVTFDRREPTFRHKADAAYKAKRKPMDEELAMQLKEKYTIVIVTHNMQQAVRISDCTAFFLLGELVEFGSTEQLFSQPKEKRTEDYITGRFG